MNNLRKKRKNSRIVCFSILCSGMRNWCGKRWGGSLLWDKLGGRWRNGHPALPRRLLSVSPDLRLEVGQQQNFHICPHNFTNVMNLEVKGGPMSYSFGNQPLLASAGFEDTRSFNTCVWISVLASHYWYTTTIGPWETFLLIDISIYKTSQSTQRKFTCTFVSWSEHL